MATPIQYGQYRVPPADEMVNFGVGQPAPGMLPLARVREATAAKFAEEDPLYLQYGYISGYPAFRKSLAGFLEKHYNQPVDPELLFVTNGVSGALALVASLFVSRGDVVVVENPSYFLALSIFRDFGLRIVPCPLDGDGLDVCALESMLRADPTLRPKFVYTIPAFQNPTGYNLSTERKQKLVQLAAEFDFTVLADEVYQLLGFDGVPPPSSPLCYFDTPETVAAGGKGGAAGHVLSIGSFAKILAPGMRLGWLQSSPAGSHLLKKIYSCGQLDSSGALNPVISGIVHTMIESGAQDAHLADVRKELTRRATVLGDALRTHLPQGAHFVQPSGGYFIWIQLPAGMTGAALLDACVARHKCRFHPGERFGSGLENFIRLSFSYYGAEDLAVGAQRLGEAMRELLAAGTPAPAPAPAPAASAAGLSIAVHGATGRLGSLIAAAATGGGGAAAGEGVPAVSYAGPVARGGAVPAGAQVVVDVTLPDGTAALIAALTAAADAPGGRALPLVVGTTGALPTEALAAYAKRAPVVVSANFSVGVPLVLSMLSAANLAALQAAGWHAEVTEVHHTAKVDAPSGTAKRLVRALSEAGVAPHGGKAGDPVPVHALRLGDTVGIHTVHLAGTGERVEITHTATRRDVFALGALRTAAWAAAQAPGLYYK